VSHNPAIRPLDATDVERASLVGAADERLASIIHGAGGSRTSTCPIWACSNLNWLVSGAGLVVLVLVGAAEGRS
jgi:hypothetical protein